MASFYQQHQELAEVYKMYQKELLVAKEESDKRRDMLIVMAKMVTEGHNTLMETKKELEKINANLKEAKEIPKTDDTELATINKNLREELEKMKKDCLSNVQVWNQTDQWCRVRKPDGHHTFGLQPRCLSYLDDPTGCSIEKDDITYARWENYEWKLDNIHSVTTEFVVMGRNYLWIKDRVR